MKWTGTKCLSMLHRNASLYHWNRIQYAIHLLGKPGHVKHFVHYFKLSNTLEDDQV